MYHICAGCFRKSSFRISVKNSHRGRIFETSLFERKTHARMSIRFFGSFVCIIVLAICLASIHSIALVENGSPPSNSSNAIYTYSIDERWPSSSALSNKGIERAAGNDGKQRYSKNGEEEQGWKENCTDSSVDDFPADLFTYEQRRNGAVVLHTFLGFYCFLLTAFVCHDYLLPSLDRICSRMNISTDVAGATFLATASSFPEMFVNLIGTFLTETDLGAGTVVGSAVFDTFATPACGALMALHAIQLEWRILSRDCLMYMISVGTLVIIMWDLRIQLYEAVTLLLVLTFYLILLFCGKGFMACCGKLVHLNSDWTTKLSDISENGPPHGTYKPHHRNDNGSSSPTTQVRGQERRPSDPENRESSEKSETSSMPDYLFNWPGEKSLLAKCWFSLGWPLKLLLFITIPDTRVERLKQWYPFTFVMCIIWIAIASYLVSWMMTVVGDTIGIPDSIMGLTFLAAGGNVPEMASIVILVRQGDGNMAMSNTLGANILDILLCLGLPWTVKCLLTGGDVRIVSRTLSYSVLSIVICIAVLYAVIAFFNFKLNKKVGFICLLLYSIFLVFAILVELNVFFLANLPMCI